MTTHIAIMTAERATCTPCARQWQAKLPEGATLSVVTDAAAIAGASHIILPGVGAFADCMQGFTALAGMRAAVEKAVFEDKKPFLGICVGMQMLFQRGHEHGSHVGLGWFEGEVRMIAPSDPALRIPHMGWNTLQLKHANRLCEGISSGDFAYFVHSYAAMQCNPAEILATVDYGGEVVALIGRANIWGAQFHPEKSQAVGLRMLRNFLEVSR